MFRRNFIGRIALAGPAITALGRAAASETKTIVYKVKGFTCPTCAVGLDTMLSQQKGVIRSRSRYPEGVVWIEFDPKLVTHNSLSSFIAEMGFQVEENVPAK
jgi:copper chaperone CopZ